MGRAKAWKCSRLYNTIIRRRPTSNLAREELPGTFRCNSPNDVGSANMFIIKYIKTSIIHNPLLLILGLQYEHGLLDFIGGSEPAHGHVRCPEELLVVARFLQLAMDFLHAFLERPEGLGFLRVEIRCCLEDCGLIQTLRRVWHEELVANTRISCQGNLGNRRNRRLIKA